MHYEGTSYEAVLMCDTTELQPRMTRGSYSPVQSARSCSYGDSPAARGGSSCSSISASRASRRVPSSPSRHWLQNCRLETKRRVISGFKEAFPRASLMFSIFRAEGTLRKLSCSPQTGTNTRLCHVKQRENERLTFWTLPRFTNSGLRGRKSEDNAHCYSK